MGPHYWRPVSGIDKLRWGAIVNAGGRSWVPPRPLEQVRQLVDDRITEEEYVADVRNAIAEALSAYNDRDTDAISKHIDELQSALSAEIDSVLKTTFGGSVAKHSYVDGLSDVDVLVDVAGTSLESVSPQHVLKRFADLIQHRLPRSDVRAGKLAITVRYSDGVEIQLLPVIRTNAGMRISDTSGMSWSHIVRPHNFARKLTEVNRERGGLVVPVIKLFKATQTSHPEDARLSGYHVEALAVNAFRNYGGPLNPKDMLGHLVNFASTAVTRPIADKTGQSLNVDDYLGAPNSTERNRVSNFLSRLANRFTVADGKRDVRFWKEELREQ